MPIWINKPVGNLTNMTIEMFDQQTQSHRPSINVTIEKHSNYTISRKVVFSPLSTKQITKGKETMDCPELKDAFNL